MGAFGGLIHGPTGHLFYGFLERKFPGASTAAVVKKVEDLRKHFACEKLYLINRNFLLSVAGYCRPTCVVSTIYNGTILLHWYNGRLLAA